MTKFFNTVPYNRPPFGDAFGNAFGNAFGPEVAGVVPAFDPLSISNIIGWWDAGQNVSTVSGDVDQWNDQSVNANHVTQTNAADRPLYDTTTDPTPFINFDGVDHFLDVATYAGGAKSQPLTYAFAAQAVTNQAIVWVFDTGTGQDDNAFLAMGTNNWQLFGNTGFDVGTPDLNKHIFILTYDGAASKFVLDGGSTITGNAGVNTQNGLTMCGRTGGSFPANYKFYDFAVYDKALSDSEKNDLGNYFKNKHTGFSWTNL